MLTEQFVAAIGTPEKISVSTVAKDAGIFIHEYQPLNQQRLIFKKSAIACNCLAVSDSHVFAAQSDRAVVRVYNREKGNQEAAVPFTERITCIDLVRDGTVLVLGTAEGRIFLWEIATGRQITTSQAHLQTVTALAIDAASNFLLSASADSTVHVWSIPGLLSFANIGTQDLAPLHTFTGHHAEIAALSIGHSSGFGNFAVSASKDQTCLIWDFYSNNVLRTYLLPAIPACLTLDAADRAVYVGYEDGSLQQLDLYAVDDESKTRPRSLHNDPSRAAFQPSERSRWRSPDNSKGAVLSISLSFDSCTLLSGHQNGTIMAWDVATSRSNPHFLQNPLPGPVTNLKFLPVIGLCDEFERSIRVPTIVKPKFGIFDSSSGAVPGNYAINVELTAKSANDEKLSSTFQQALTASAFQSRLLDHGLAELASWHHRSLPNANGHTENESDDFVAFDGGEKYAQQLSLDKQNAALKAQLSAMRRLQSASFEKMERLNDERKVLLRREQDRLRGHDNGIIDPKFVPDATSSENDNAMSDGD